VEFTWYEDKAIKPVWRDLTPSMVEIVKELMEMPQNG
jgi:hypothetical protein